MVESSASRAATCASRSFALRSSSALSASVSEAAALSSALALARALAALSEVESTAVGAALAVSFLSVEVGGGYAYAEGGAFDLSLHCGICSLALRPMAAVGWKASETKRRRGCQNQKCVKTPTPTMAGMTRADVFERSEMVTLRPPASSSPVATIAPNLVIVSSCLSPTTLCRCLRCSDSRDSSWWSDDCIRTIDVASSAPCRT
mmetsp:Transcript_24783/g.57741  ORF Transcript_24783/g.57741 Transcript_24783/m.57741 type:complete len:205 (+) Transcript_24783:682-1296(+)